MSNPSNVYHNVLETSLGFNEIFHIFLLKLFFEQSDHRFRNDLSDALGFFFLKSSSRRKAKSCSSNSFQIKIRFPICSGPI